MGSTLILLYSLVESKSILQSRNPARHVLNLDFLASTVNHNEDGRAIIADVTLRQFIPGLSLFASSISIFAGVQLFAIGIIGEYLARMHFRMLDRPSYLVKNEAEHVEDESDP